MAGTATAVPVPKKDTIPYKTYNSEFFSLLPVQQDYNGVYYRTFDPQTSINNTDIVVFELPRMSNTQVYLLNRISVLASFKIVDKNGDNPDEEIKVAPCNDILNS